MCRGEIQTKTRYCGGIGRHKGLKIPRLVHTSSSLVSSTTCCFAPFIMAKRKDAWRFGQTNGKNTLLYIGDWRNGSAADFDSVGRSSILLSPASPLTRQRFYSPNCQWQGECMNRVDYIVLKFLTHPSLCFEGGDDSADYCLVGDIYSVSTKVSVSDL